MKIDHGYNYAYLYGLSDFWVSMFQDPELNQLLLESTSISYADAYSKFLQLTSAMTIDDVSTGIGSDIRLILLDIEGIPDANQRVFPLPNNVASARVLSDRPLIPVKSLEQDVDYEISLVDNTITFAKPFLSYGFPYTITDTATYRFALWATDCVVDPELVAKVYAPLVRIGPEASSAVYKDFIRGLFFLYTNGPNIAYMGRGLSLALGIPLARTNEVVLLTTQDAQTGQWIVVTDYNSYTLPYSIAPTVAEGDVLQLGDSLSNVVEIQDYLTDGEWWINLYIPANVLPASVSRPGGGTAVPGSDIDYVMRAFLKSHTFLVKVNWQPGYEINGFENLASMVKNVKPSYTLGIFAWSVPIGIEVLDPEDEDEGFFVVRPTVEDFEDVGPRAFIYREEVTPEPRRNAWFIRCNSDPDSLQLLGDTPTEDPDFTLNSSDYLYGSGATTVISYSQLMPMYNAFETEIEAKLIHLGLTPTLPLPDTILLTGTFAGDEVLLSRDLVTLPVATSDYYSEVSVYREDNMFRAEDDGYVPEINRSFYMDTGGLSDPITLVVTRMYDGGNVYSVHAVHDFGTSETGPRVVPQLPIPKEEDLVILMT